MKREEFFRQMLVQKFHEAKTRNTRFSMRAFAQKLDLNSGVLSSVLRGDRKISSKLVMKTMKALPLDPQETLELESYWPEIAVRKRVEPLRYKKLKTSTAELLDWHHYAILALMRTDGFKNDVSWIERKLRLQPNEASRALATLLEGGLIEYDPEGSLQRKAARFRTSDNVLSLPLQKLHSKNLKLASRALEETPMELRDFSAMTMAISPSRLPEARVLIRKFTDELSALLEKSPRKEIYKLCVQLFPLSDETIQ